MTRQRRGAVVNLSSVAGLLGNAGQANYAAAKAGVVGFTKSLAQEVGRYGICANVVTPGHIATDPVRQLPEEMLERAVERVELRRLGNPEEVADLASFLLSDRAAYLTAACSASTAASSDRAVCRRHRPRIGTRRTPATLNTPPPSGGSGKPRVNHAPGTALAQEGGETMAAATAPRTQPSPPPPARQSPPFTSD